MPFFFCFLFFSCDLLRCAKQLSRGSGAWRKPVNVSHRRPDIGALDDAYNQDFMRAADIFHVATKACLCAEEWAKHAGAVPLFHLVIGLGGRAALRAQGGLHQRFKAVYTAGSEHIGGGVPSFAFLHATRAPGIPTRDPVGDGISIHKIGPSRLRRVPIRTVLPEWMRRFMGSL